MYQHKLDLENMDDPGLCDGYPLPEEEVLGAFTDAPYYGFAERDTLFPNVPGVPNVPAAPNYQGFPNVPGKPAAPGPGGAYPGFPGQGGVYPDLGFVPAAPGRLPEGLPAAPPERVPVRPSGIGARAVDPAALYGCIGRPTYIWLRNGGGFWFYPMFAGRRSVAGYRWSQRGWGYTGVDTDWIDFFHCV